MKKLLLIPLLAIMSTSVSAKVCKDDPRLYTIKTVIEKMDAGEIVKPIKLTPQTFLDMPHLVRNKLGDNIRVYDNACVPNQVYQGTLPKSIEMPFHALENSLQKALMRNDKKMADVIVNQFIAEPITTHESLSLISALPWVNSAISNLYKNNYLEKVSQHNYSRKECLSIKAKPTLLEIYALLNGKVSDNILTGFSGYQEYFKVGTINGSSYLNTGEVVRFEYESGYFRKCSGVSPQRTYNSLAKIKVNISNYGEGATYQSMITKELNKIKLNNE